MYVALCWLKGWQDEKKEWCCDHEERREQCCICKYAKCIQMLNAHNDVLRLSGVVG